SGAPRRIRVLPGSWTRIRKPEDATRAQERLWDSLPRESDGYIARFDRGLSIALSKRLIALPVTPNQLTALGLGIGLLGAALLAQPSYPLCVLGALLLCSCCILDGCDGEVARLKLLDSPAGARFDALADNAVHLAVFIAIPAHVAAAHPGAEILRPALALLSGFLLSAFWTWRLILRAPGRSPLQRIFERVASRDFLYLVLLLALARRLDWFLWAAAAGSHLFWAALLAGEMLPRGKRAP
ncbi:MAG: CDP-alcohol phosphatidyltransferase family protein, partial [Elusimicrobiota bacterium]